MSDAGPASGPHLNADSHSTPIRCAHCEGQAYFVPNARESFRKSTDKNLLVHFSAYRANGSTAPVVANIEFLQGARTVSKAAGQLPPPDASGRIAYLTAFALDGFPAGRYEIRVTITDGATQSTSSANFAIEP